MDETSVLFLAPKWKYDAYGIATINRSIINDLWMVGMSRKIKMTCALLEQQDDKITDQERRDAKRHCVKLIGTTLPRGTEELPDVTDVDRYCCAFFRHIDFKRLRVTHIVGHVPYMFNAAFSLQDIFKVAGQSPKVISIVHALPRKRSDVDIFTLHDALKESDIVVSIGHLLYREISKHIGTLEEGSKPRHKVYIPGGPLELLSTKRPSNFELKHGPHNVLVITGERKNMHVRGLDYDVAVAASTLATGNIGTHADPHQRLQLLTVGPSQHERDSWERHFDDVKGKVEKDYKLLNFEYQCFRDVSDLRKFFQMSSVCILPFKHSATVFGIEGLWAAFAGVPVLVSCNTGIARFLQSLNTSESLIKQHADLHEGERLWTAEIQRKICNPDTARGRAKNLQQKCLYDTSIAYSHLELIRTILGL